MKTRYALIAAMSALPMLTLMPTEAEASKCRQYTKTIRIDGKLELGVGSACETRSGDWEIVSLKGARQAQDYLEDYIYNDLYDDGYRVVVVNNYTYGRPAYYYPRVNYHYYAPKPRYYGYRHDKHDNYGHKGKGKGRGNGHHGHKKHH